MGEALSSLLEVRGSKSAKGAALEPNDLLLGAVLDSDGLLARAALGAGDLEPASAAEVEREARAEVLVVAVLLHRDNVLTELPDTLVKAKAIPPPVQDSALDTLQPFARSASPNT